MSESVIIKKMSAIKEKPGSFHQGNRKCKMLISNSQSSCLHLQNVWITSLCYQAQKHRIWHYIICQINYYSIQLSSHVNLGWKKSNSRKTLLVNCALRLWVLGEKRGGCGIVGPRVISGSVFECWQVLAIYQNTPSFSMHIFNSVAVTTHISC